MMTKEEEIRSKALQAACTMIAGYAAGHHDMSSRIFEIADELVKYIETGKAEVARVEAHVE
jgi:hypothetical protein